MTTQEIAQLERRIAEKVFGFSKIHFPAYLWPQYAQGYNFEKLLAKCAEKCQFHIRIKGGGNGWTIYGEPDEPFVQDESLPLALARFAAALFDPAPKTVKELI